MRRCVPWGRPAIAWLPSRTISSGATANVFGQNTICMTTAMLDQICSPADLRKLDRRELKNLARQLRGFVLESVSRTGGHLSSNLGTVELTIALHYVRSEEHTSELQSLMRISYAVFCLKQNTTHKRKRINY